MISLLSMPLAIRLAWTLVHFLWQGALMGGLAWMMLSLLKRKRPQVRYLVACFFLVACLVAPVVTFFWMAGTPAPAVIELSQGAWQQARSYQALSALRHGLQPMLPWLLSLYVVGLFLLSLRTFGGWLYLQELKGKAQDLGPDWSSMLNELVDQLGIHRPVRFLESARVLSPMASGILKPVVLLPLNFFANLDAVAAEAILVHELAHIRRYDVIVNGCQCVVETLLFFHPAVWWISWRIRVEREHCCDDVAVSNCGDPLLFVEILAQLDELRQPTPQLAMAVRGGNLMERMRRLLAPDLALLRIPAPSLPVMVAFLLGGTVLLARQEEVKRVLVQLPQQLSNLTEDMTHVAHRESAGLVAGLQTWTPNPESRPKVPAVRHERTEPERSVALPDQMPEVHLGVAEAEKTEPRVTSESEPEPLCYRVKVPGAPCPTSIGKLPENSFSERWPANDGCLEATTLPFRTYSPYVAHPLESNAYRIVRVHVEPGERLSFKLHGEGAKVVMEALVPSPEPNLAWRNALKQANFPPHQVRQSRLEISNPTEESRDFDLILFGVHGYAYRVELERKHS